ncbi:parvulin-like peptidyl-prolyl isomerase [Candidatus Scalindua japonica]|uniref:Parvulin-like peptidyl-prolyl isomerase n=1 Tax=Candidatus Scalindua japonica TaxID=1284222 RepID=A0A286TUF6_9BACT|nr:peptidylprolyl isomerase [Candidatus Scalindua japonica]GAX59527.1 parvulin-like peptidyl-prolyl isomerase [Candidatus Scalindua japonica]
MYRMIVTPIILFLFILQTNNFLFASDNAVVKAEAITATAEANVKESTAAIAEKKAKAEENVKAFPTAVNSQITDSVTQSAPVEGIKDVVKKAEETVKEVVASAVAEEKVKPDESAEAVVEKESDVIATVNGEKILRLDFDKRLNVFRRMNQDVTNTIKMQVVSQLTKKELLRQFVDKQDINTSKEDVQAEIEKIKFFLQNNPANKDKPLEEILETQGSSVSELEDEVSRALALSKYLEKTVNDADKREYFNANKDAFNGSRVKASHVLIDTKSMKTDAEKAEAKKMIDIVKMEIDKGADFAEMAKKYSNCPSAENGGDIGFFQRKGSIVEEFAKVAYAMDVGEISDPVETEFGYHIIKVTEKEEGKDVNYEDVTDMVDFVFMQIKTESLLKELYDKAKIEIML